MPAAQKPSPAAKNPTNRAGGIIAMNLAAGDELMAARITDGTMNVFLGSATGKSIRFHETDVRPTGRTAGGIRGLRLESGDSLVGMEVLSHGQTLFTVTENGYGKRTSIDEYPVQKRGGKGVITIKTNERNGLVVALLLVAETDERCFEAELHRLKGELLLAQSTGTEAEASFRGAVEVARGQQAKSWELRAATSLARLWHAQDRTDEARQALAEIYDWFTEGFDTRDLLAAKALLEELEQDA